jgi:hypothetical protein
LTDGFFLSIKHIKMPTPTWSTLSKPLKIRLTKKQSKLLGAQAKKYNLSALRYATELVLSGMIKKGE